MAAEVVAFPMGAATLQRYADLAATGAQIVTALSGKWNRDRGLCLCPAHDDRTPSLSVRVGAVTLLFTCFAGCERVSILAALRSRNLAVPLHAEMQPGGQRASDKSRNSGLVRRLWHEGKALGGTSGAAYLRRRGILALPSVLRFHPRCPVGSGAGVRFRPAIIAAVEGSMGISAIQRLFVNPAGRGCAADLVIPKLSLGRLGGGAVRLSTAGSELGLAEGIETAMSATALLGIPVWAVVGGSRMHTVDIPRGVRRLVLLPDNDPAGRVAAVKAQKFYGREDRELRVEWPPDDFNDWNDVLRDRG